MNIRVEHGDCRQVMRRLAEEDVRVDSVCCDPPYHLASIVKRFGGETAAPAQFGKDGAFGRAARGFMGKVWDGGDIAFRPETWRLCFDLMKPGAYIVAFGSSRGYGRLQVAMEDAGFITHPMVGRLSSIFDRLCALSETLTDDQADELWRIIDAMLPGGLNGWVFGSGFPKATRLKAPNTDHLRYGLQALKPALEPIYMGQKPMEGTGTANWLAHGTGALNIDACRVGTDSTRRTIDRPSPGSTEQYRLRRDNTATGSDAGRWPANLVHDGSDEVLEAFAQFGERTSGKASTDGHKRRSSLNSDMAVYNGGLRSEADAGKLFGDTGSAARFFFSAKADADDRCDSKHPTVKPIALMRWLVRLVTPPRGVVLDPFAGSGTTGAACMREGFDAILIEREEEYYNDIKRRLDRMQGLDSPLFQSLASELPEALL